MPREFFFDDLDLDIAAAVKQALSVISHATAGVRDVTLPGRISDLEAARGVVRSAEAYTYHREWIANTPDRYQPETLERLRADTQVTTPAFIQALRQEAQARRAIDGVFATIDVLITPTVPLAPHRLADFGPDVNTRRCDWGVVRAQYVAIQRLRYPLDISAVRLHERRSADRIADQRAERR